MHNPEECNGCYFLRERAENSSHIDWECWNGTTHSLKDVKVCLSGVLFQRPKTGEELAALIKNTEDHWRKEGENGNGREKDYNPDELGELPLPEPSEVP